MLSYLQKVIRNAFGFSQRETNGTILLFAIIVLLLFLPYLQNLLFKQTFKDSANQVFQDSIVAYLENLQNENEPIFPEIELSPFDPNKLSKEDWIKLGLNENTAQRIENYRKKGGKFRKKEDLLRVYDFPEELYQTLEPFIAIEGSNWQKKPSKQPFRQYSTKQNKQEYFERKFAYYKDSTQNRNNFQQKVTKFDLNQADTARLKKLRGIGEKRAMTIIKYREKLGGFASMEQISEIWGLDSVSINSLKKYAYILPNSWKKIAINTASVNDLKGHPYIGFRLANTIVNYRLQHGKFKDEADLAKIKAIDETTLQKLKPYLLFD